MLTHPLPIYSDVRLAPEAAVVFDADRVRLPVLHLHVLPIRCGEVLSRCHPCLVRTTQQTVLHAAAIDRGDPYCDTVNKVFRTMAILI